MSKKLSQAIAFFFFFFFFFVVVAVDDEIDKYKSNICHAFGCASVSYVFVFYPSNEMVFVALLCHYL